MNLIKKSSETNIFAKSNESDLGEQDIDQISYEDNLG